MTEIDWPLAFVLVALIGCGTVAFCFFVHMKRISQCDLDSVSDEMAATVNGLLVELDNRIEENRTLVMQDIARLWDRFHEQVNVADVDRDRIDALEQRIDDMQNAVTASPEVEAFTSRADQIQKRLEKLEAYWTKGYENMDASVGAMGESINRRLDKTYERVDEVSEASRNLFLQAEGFMNDHAGRLLKLETALNLGNAITGNVPTIRRGREAMK